MKESDLVRDIRLLLTQYEKDAKILWWERLNSGEVLVKKGPTTYKVLLCRTGTPDFIVVSAPSIECMDDRNVFDIEVDFLECKTDKGKLSKEQIDFQHYHCDMGWWAQFHVVRDIDYVKKLYGGKDEG